MSKSSSYSHCVVGASQHQSQQWGTEPQADHPWPSSHRMLLVLPAMHWIIHGPAAMLAGPQGQPFVAFSKGTSCTYRLCQWLVLKPGSSTSCSHQRDHPFCHSVSSCADTLSLVGWRRQVVVWKWLSRSCP
jgi:hypothetical protein